MKAAAAIAFGVVLAIACGGKNWGEPVVAKKSPVAPPADDGGTDAGTSALRSVRVTTLTERAVGPFLAWNGDGGMIAWVGGKTGARNVIVSPLDATGTPHGTARAIATIPTDASSLVLRKVPGDGKARYLLAWTTLSDSGESVVTVTVDKDGAPLSAPATIAQTTDDVVWTEIIPTERGAVCVWAAQTSAGDANLLAIGLDANGKPRGVAGAIARGVVGWQAVRAGGGAGVAVVRAAHTKVKPALGSLAWMRLDAEARAVGDTIAIVPDDAVGGDFDVTRLEGAEGDSFVFAWTDRRGQDPEVTLAALDAHGKLTGPTQLDAHRGGHSLVDVMANASGVMVSWEEARKRELSTRRVSSVLVKPTDLSTIDPGAVLELRSSGAPELRPTQDGFAWLATTRACREEPCKGAPVRSSFVRMNARLDVSEVQILDESVNAAAAWSLDCAGDRCAALVAMGGAETRVSFVDLSPQPSRAVAPLAPSPRSPLRSLSTLMSGGAISDIATATVGDARVLASLARDETTKTDDETLTVRSMQGGVWGKATVLSTHAIPAGSVSMAGGADGAAIAWISHDGNDAQVHLAKVDAKGKRLKETRLTSAPGNKSDVAIVRVADGFVVAWVDTRDKNGEVYAAHTNADLERNGREERVTNAPGDATDLVLVAAKDHVIAAWADSRESVADGFADVYAASLGAKDAKPLAGDSRVLATAAHSRSPSLAVLDDQVGLAWIEEAPVNAGPSDAYGGMLATLDSKAKVVGDPKRLHLPGEGVETRIALDASSSGLRGVVAESTPDALVLWVFRATGNDVKSARVVSLDGPPSLDVPLELAQGDLFFGDDGPEASDARLRYATIDPASPDK